MSELIKWSPIRDKYTYGYEASLGNRGVEVARLYSGAWEVFPMRDGRILHCGNLSSYRPEAYQFHTFLTARNKAAEYLRTGIYDGKSLDDVPTCNPRST